MSGGATEAALFHSHLMRCRSCFAPNDHYCDTGRELRLAADAAFIAALPDLHQRRYWRALEHKKNPSNVERLDELIKQKFEERTVGGNLVSKTGGRLDPRNERTRRR